MNDAQLTAFRNIAAVMDPGPHDWEWVGVHVSQRMFGITRQRAESYMKLYGGTARLMLPDILPARYS